jgi:hypothetical protein
MRSVIGQWHTSDFFNKSRLDSPDGDIGPGIEQFAAFIPGAEAVSAADFRIGKQNGHRTYHIAECGTLKFTYGHGGISAELWYDVSPQVDIASNLVSAAFVSSQISRKVSLEGSV